MCSAQFIGTQITFHRAFCRTMDATTYEIYKVGEKCAVHGTFKAEERLALSVTVKEPRTSTVETSQSFVQAEEFLQIEGSFKTHRECLVTRTVEEPPTYSATTSGAFSQAQDSLSVKRTVWGGKKCAAVCKTVDEPPEKRPCSNDTSKDL
uniref:Lipocln_cytosolic_FA-bd_dom domain-containing protein n=1 Tax=Steinernema glaseri TaxID=37863 RepID=A0A1I7ZJC8_9BILA